MVVVLETRRCFRISAPKLIIEILYKHNPKTQSKYSPNIVQKTVLGKFREEFFRKLWNNEYDIL